MSNHLQRETSPYLLQHKDNPVDWYPWCREAFDRARAEDKPVFLSIGYSTCHWCHVMARESFEDGEVAALLNRYFISVKVDREERPDIDSVYMAVCQAFTGSGGWPATIFLTAEQKPFFAGTYFPKESRRGLIGLKELLALIHEKWESDRESLLRQAEEVVAALRRREAPAAAPEEELPEEAVAAYKASFDPVNGGFGGAPKFPAAHNLLFLLTYHERCGDKACLEMAERTLRQMYRGGLFDHIGGGFCRYATDERFLIPHFEKMLYDNALLILAYCKAYGVTKNAFYRDVAERTAAYVLGELTAPEGGFYSAQDADSGGEEGKYYAFTPEELTALLGEETGAAFCRCFGITREGNFPGGSIPNLLDGGGEERAFANVLPLLRRYRRQRSALHLDDKVLTAWNALMIAALCRLYRADGDGAWLTAAKRAERFLWENLREGEELFVSFRAGKRGVKGFLDDYAAYIFALLALHEATLEEEYLARAERLCAAALSAFRAEDGGFYLSAAESGTPLLRPRETFDGAMPSGNSLLAWDLVRLWLLTGEGRYEEQAARQLRFLAAEAARYPAGHAMFLLALLERRDPPARVTAVLRGTKEREGLPLLLPPDTVLRVLPEPTEAFPLRDGRSTFYICRGHSCLPPVHDLRGRL
ncbi:MAG: thioredoxin domain-containing protein [Oscillospiraceae bacterium]